MGPVKRRDIEAESLCTFHRVLAELGIKADGSGYGGENRFDPQFGLLGQQRFQFGDLWVMMEDRIVIIEVESGGGLTNLVKYWPLSESLDRPVLLLHAFGQGSVNDYLSHLRLWEYVWAKMRKEIWNRHNPRLFARRFQYTMGNPAGLLQACEVFRACLTRSLSEVTELVFGFNSPRGGKERTPPGPEAPEE